MQRYRDASGSSLGCFSLTSYSCKPSSTGLGYTWNYSRVGWGPAWIMLRDDVSGPVLPPRLTYMLLLNCIFTVIQYCHHHMNHLENVEKVALLESMLKGNNCSPYICPRLWVLDPHQELYLISKSKSPLCSSATVLVSFVFQVNTK